jgi:hypothetical protein
MIGLKERWIRAIFVGDKNYEYRYGLSPHCIGRWVLVRGHFWVEGVRRVSCKIVGGLLFGPPNFKASFEDTDVYCADKGWETGRQAYPILDRVMFPPEQWLEVQYKNLAPRGVRVRGVLQPGELDYGTRALYQLSVLLEQRGI